MKNKLTLLMDSSTITHMKSYLEKKNISLSQWTEIMYKKALQETPYKKQSYTDIDELIGSLPQMTSEEVDQAKWEYLSKKHHLS